MDAMSDEELAGRIDAAAHLAAAELYLDRYEDASAHAERALGGRPRDRTALPHARFRLWRRASSCAAGWPRPPR